MYATAPQELELRFGGPDIIVNNYINKLQQLRMPSMQYKQLFMDFSSFICNLREMFQTFGVTNDLNSSIYVQFAANKRHHSERLQWTHLANLLRQVNKETVNVKATTIAATSLKHTRTDFRRTQKD